MFVVLAKIIYFYRMVIKKYSELTQEERDNFLDLEDLSVQVDVSNLTTGDICNIIDYVGLRLTEQQSRILELERESESLIQANRGNELLEKHIKVLESRLLQLSPQEGEIDPRYLINHFTDAK